MENKGRLVLGRYRGQSIMIDDNIEVTVKNVDCDGLVRLQVKAPKEMNIDRREIWEDKKRDKDK